MAKQTFTSGQVLTAAEMNSLQENDYNWTVTTKTASYTLAAGDEGTRIVMNNAGATTITVDDAIFAAGDVVWIHNIGAGTCTITAGTATVSTVGELALEQYAGGHLYFTSASAAIFFPTEQGGGGKILQVVTNTYATTTSTTSTSYVDSNLDATITPTSATSKIIVMTFGRLTNVRFGTPAGASVQLLRGATILEAWPDVVYSDVASATLIVASGTHHVVYEDSPATTSATTYKLQFKSVNASNTAKMHDGNTTSTMILMEVSA